MYFPYSFFSKGGIISGADGDLVVLSGQVYNIDPLAPPKQFNSILVQAGGYIQFTTPSFASPGLTTYSISNPTHGLRKNIITSLTKVEIGCKNSFTLNGTINANYRGGAGTLFAGSTIFGNTGYSAFSTSQPAGGNGGAGGSFNNLNNLPGGLGSASGLGGGGSGGGNGSGPGAAGGTNGGNGGTGAAGPGGPGGAGGTGNFTLGDGSDGAITGVTTGGAGGAGGGSGGGGGAGGGTTSGAGGGGAGGGYKGNHGILINLYLEGAISGNGFIITGENGFVGGKGGDGFAAGGGGGGGGGGAAGSPGAVFIHRKALNLSSITVDVSAKSGGAGGLGGTNNLGWNGSPGSAGGNSLPTGVFSQIQL